MVVSLIPSIVYHIQNGENDIATRNLLGVEIYSLRITQFFMPLYSHGIDVIERITSEYTSNVPFVNENSTVYLGIVGCIGLVVGIAYVFAGDKENKQSFLLARLNLASILFMTMGGFISLLAVTFKIYVMRGFNRISVYVMYACLLIVFSLFQNLYDKIKQKHYRVLCVAFMIGVTIIGLWDQTPMLFDNGSSLISSKLSWDNDEEFISEIEKTLERGDMVYQLPYHPYPEGGKVNDMNDYQLLIGYIHSDALKWSYGGIKGRDSDLWNKTVSEMDVQSMITTLVETGFKGIYIDKRAYTEDEFEKLSTEIESVIDVKPIISKDECLVFYNLYPYINKR